jgi:hypothetical protein
MSTFVTIPRSSSRRLGVHRLSKLCVCLAAACCAVGTLAAPLASGSVFDLTVNVGGSYNAANDSISGGLSSATLGVRTVSEMFDSTDRTRLNAINGSYSDQSASVIRLGYRGLPIVLTTSAGSPAVTMLIPGLDVAQVFNAKSTRDDNVRDIREFLKSSGGDLLNRLQQLLAKTSPVDPIAGNPTSMQSRMVGDDFDRNFTQQATNIKAEPGLGLTSSNNLIGVGASFGSFTQGGVTSKVVTLPLSYTSRSDIDPRRQLTIYAPVTVSDVAGAKSYGVNFGAAYRIPVNDEWALSPAVGYGVAGSVDLGSAAAMMAASLTSQYTVRRDGYDIAIGNMIGVYQSSKFSAGGYSFDPKIRNTVLRNGVMVSVPITLMGSRLAYEVSLINTQYSGTSLYSRSYNEVGLTLGTNKGANSARSYLRAGLTYLTGQNGIRGSRVNVGYWF